jgi:hypothetical protein
MEFYVVRAVHFGMKLYNDQRNAQGFNLFINLLLPYMFQASFSPSSEAGVQIWQWFKPPVSAQVLTPYPGDCRICTPASENVLKESPKYVRQN